MVYKGRMEIHIHAPHLELDQDATRQQVEHALRHFTERLTRVDVFLKDVNGDKGGIDKHCTFEARPRGLDPVAVDHTAETVQQALTGSASKLERRLEHVFAKHDGPRG